jgi:6-phosphofructokinase 2
MYPVSTITLNPCIDKSTVIPMLVPEKKLRCQAPKFEPGGGGINVARVLNRFGCKTLAIYPAGGYSGRFLTQLLVNENIPSICIETAGHTRENLIVLEGSTGRQYRFGMPGTALQKEETLQCLKIVEQTETKYLVLSGGLPPEYPLDDITAIARMAKQRSVKLIVDTNGAPLKSALDVGVFMIKPNLRELGVLFGRDATIENAGTLAKEIVDKGQSKIVIVSLGSAGAMLVTNDICIQFSAPHVKTLSTVGAGDSMVAGIVLKLHDGWHIQEACRYGVACGSAATMNPGTGLCHLKDVEQLYKTMQPH